MPSVSINVWLFFCTLAVGAVSALEVGDNLCIQGYVMDYYCIDNVRMIDNGKKTLEKPFDHSVHCLVDVSDCYNSAFEVLTDPATDGALYTRGYRLTEESKQEVMSLAFSVGSCSRCVNGYDNSKLANGFRAVFNVTVVDLNEDDDDTPPTVVVHSQEYPDPTDTNPCLTVFGLVEGQVMGNDPNITNPDDDGSDDDSAAGWIGVSSSFVATCFIALAGLLL